MLTARRGLGPDEYRLIMPPFLAAVRWAVFVERIAVDLPDIRRAAKADAGDLKGARLTDFIGMRNQARAEVKKIDALLYPPDDEPIEATDAVD